ncbi:hypothetical protein L596_012400 [Steinernema carpocapsae]|nr:hypothetical protein L596_012400 [Steinernema carpocapsae]
MVYVHDSDWNVCVAKKVAKIGQYDTLDRTHCEQKGMQMDRQCTGPYDPSEIMKTNDGSTISPSTPCSNIICHSSDHYCTHGMVPVCCNKKHDKALEEANAAKCPNGGKAAGVGSGSDFNAIFGRQCSDLICGQGEKCVQVNQYFAKCCGSK